METIKELEAEEMEEILGTITDEDEQIKRRGELISQKEE